MSALLRHPATLLGLAAALTMAACTGKRESNAMSDSATVPAEPTSAQGAQSTPGMEGMQGMSGMADMQSGGMMGQMQGHMRMMESANDDSLRTMLAMHRQMMGNMLADMNGEMKRMKMTGDAAWTATADSLRQDLAKRPDMTAAQIRTFMPEHRGRMMRLMAMHQGMMKNMKM